MNRTRPQKVTQKGTSTRVRSAAGSAPTALLAHGILGRGILVSIQLTQVSTGSDFDRARLCVFTVEVALNGAPRYSATCRQAVRTTILPQLMLPGATVAVRVDPHDHARIALSLGEDPPTVAMAGPESATTEPDSRRC